MTKTILRALKGEVLPTPPIWMMRQAGRYLPEYRETRGRAGDFLSLCYTPDLAAEVTLQPIRRYGFDAAILFADILLLPQALGPKLWFETGEGPRMETTDTPGQVANLKPADAIHETLAPVYQTVRILAEGLPKETTLIGFAGAPWTVATYMIAGRGSKDQAAAHKLKAEDRATFQALIDRITEATVEYLSAQVEAGAEVVKLFDSWAGSLKGQDFRDFAEAPAAKIIAALKARHPGIPVIAFPREAGPGYAGFARTTGADGGLRGDRQFGQPGVGGGECPDRRAGAGQPGTRAHGHRGAGAGGGDAACGQGVRQGAAYLQPGPRDHARGKPGPCAADDRHGAGGLRAWAGCWPRWSRRSPRPPGTRRRPA